MHGVTNIPPKECPRKSRWMDMTVFGVDEEVVGGWDFWKVAMRRPDPTPPPTGYSSVVVVKSNNGTSA